MSDEQHESGLAVHHIAQPAPTEESAVLVAAKPIPFRMAVSVPVPGVTLRQLRGLHPQQIFQTEMAAADDVPVRVGGALFAWAELDSSNGQMAVRLTRFR